MKKLFCFLLFLCWLPAFELHAQTKPQKKTTTIPDSTAIDTTKTSTAQEQISEEKKQPKLTLQGYVKDLETFILERGFDSLLADNLIHNRLNFRYQADSSLKFIVEVRNRIFYGDLLRTLPQYPQLIDSNNDIWDLSAMPVKSRSFLIHTMLDRAFAEYTRKKLEVRLGRQRINWGLNLVWNPNDIFNAYSYFDFDYEERPGSDALRVRYFSGVAGSTELAARLTSDPDKMTVAGLYKFNQNQYDFQVLGGVFQREIAVGGGWAGSIQDAGFKGEITYLQPYQHLTDSSGQLLASVSADYSFPSSFYLHGAVLFNSQGQKHPETLLPRNFTTGRLSVKNLSPYKYSLFGQISYPIYPLLNASFATMYFPQDPAFFFYPVLTYSASENLDLDAIGQLFYNTGSHDFRLTTKVLYLRLKWSF